MLKDIEYYLKEDTLLICPDNFKTKVLEYLSNKKIIANVNFLTLAAYKKSFFFDYDTEAVNYLMNKYDLSVKNAKEILNNLIFIDSKRHYSIEKLDKLVTYKKDLDEAGLLSYDPLFLNYIQGKNIVVMGYGKLNSFDRNILRGKSIKVVEYERVEKEYQIKKFNDIEDEVEHLYAAIYDLLDKGIDINKIYVLNSSSEYESYFKRFNLYYGFEINYEQSDSLLSLALTDNFIELLDNNDKESIYNYLVAYDNEVASKLIGLLNKYAAYDLSAVKSLIIDDLSSIKLKNNKKTNVVQAVEMFNEFEDDDQVFLIGFHDSCIQMKTDIEYLTDNVRPFVNKPLVEEENSLLKENVVNYLANINNLFLSYCEKTPFNKHDAQNLLSASYHDEKTASNYSDNLNKVKYAYMLDRLRKYGSKSDSIEDMSATYGDNDYLKYQNSFKKLSAEQIKKFKSVKLSYSAMNNYYECAFKYYLNNILKINETAGNYNTKIGSLVHGVFQDLYSDDDFDFEISWKRNIFNLEQGLGEELFIDEKEKYFKEKLKEEVREDVEIIIRQKNEGLQDKQRCENNFNIAVEDGISFTGFIDKLMYREKDGEKLVSIVDYKTGNSSSINKKLMEYGLSLQLPSYLYLLNHDEGFKDALIGGFYLQHVINSNIRYDKEKDKKELKNESMKLEGYSSNDIDRLRICDPDLKNIDGISLKADGSFTARSRVLSDEEMADLIKLVEDKVKEAGHKILSGKFEINPKQIDKKNFSCQYCPYSDICYKRNSDLIIINSKEDGDEAD